MFSIWYYAENDVWIHYATTGGIVAARDAFIRLRSQGFRARITGTNGHLVQEA